MAQQNPMRINYNNHNSIAPKKTMKWINRVSTKPEHCRSDGSNEKSKIKRIPERNLSASEVYSRRSNANAHTDCLICGRSMQTLGDVAVAIWKWVRSEKITLGDACAQYYTYSVFCSYHHSIQRHTRSHFLLPTEKRSGDEEDDQQKKGKRKIPKTYEILHIYFMVAWHVNSLGSLFALHWNWIINKSFLCRPTEQRLNVEMTTKRWPNSVRRRWILSVRCVSPSDPLPARMN